MTSNSKEISTVLVVDDDVSVLSSLAMLLKQHGFSVLKAESPEQALELLPSHGPQLVLQDMNFSRSTSGEEGMKLLQDIKTEHPDIPVVLMTAWGSIELAVNGIKAGARDFITKPWDNQQLIRTVRTCIELNQDSQLPQFTRKQLDDAYDFDAIIGADPKLMQVLATIGRVAATDASVLILGESGTGKELIADAVHRNSRRQNAELVKVNLGGLTASLFESEMFGHVKGAFTDAIKDRKGRFEIADSGTIFLDEIGDLDPASQVKLLRVLQDQKFQRVGSSQTLKVNVRVISATNRDLAQMVREGRFREDLLYRLNLITVELPPLRDRRDDIPLLAAHHLSTVEKRYGLAPLTITPEALHWLKHQPWPGNIRQLCQTIERAVLMSGQQHLDLAHFEQNGAEAVRDSGSSAAQAAEELPIANLTLEQMEKLMIERALEEHNSNVTHVARALGLSRAALYRRLEKYGLDE